MPTVNFIVAVYDLTDGREVARKEFEHFIDAAKARRKAIYWWEEPVDENDPCPFGVLLFTSSGNIVYGFGED